MTIHNAKNGMGNGHWRTRYSNVTVTVWLSLVPDKEGSATSPLCRTKRVVPCAKEGTKRVVPCARQRG